MIEALKAKKILFIAPNFFGYQIAIADKLRALGASVDFFDERPKNSTFVKACIRAKRSLIERVIRKYYHDILESISGIQYDYVFILNIEAMLPDILAAMKRQHSTATFILYMWDSLKNKKHTADVLPYFDRIFSFDKSDASILKKVRFRPLFFLDEYATRQNGACEEVVQYDMCFLGTVHSDRYNLIKEMETQALKLGLSRFFFMYFPSPLLFFYKKIRDSKFRRARFAEFSFTSLNKAAIVNIVKGAKVVLDIQHPSQVGLTMRTMEVLGAGKKLVTTNAHIKEYDFYKEENILVIDRDQPVLSELFLKTPYSPVDFTIRQRYSLEGWISEIFL